MGEKGARFEYVGNGEQTKIPHLIGHRTPFGFCFRLRLDHPRGGGRSTQPLRSPTPRQVTRLDAGFSQNGTENRGDCFLAAGRTPRGRCILGGLWIVMAGLSVAKFSPLITRLGSSFARREELKTENQSRPRRQPDLRAAAIHQRVPLDS